jgi:GNAT superfamily N-acetyltransferase
MAIDFTVVLEVPPEPGYEALVRALVLDAAGRAGIASDRHAPLAAAVALGCDAIVAEAMAESRSPIKVTARGTADSLSIALLERGLPLDDAAAARDPRWADLLEVVDSCGWHAHGTGGSELRLTVAASPRESSDATSEGIDPLDSHEEPPTTASERSYIYRAFEPRDAAAVTRIFYRTYGYRYTPTLFYSPERLIAANASGAIHSFVAEADDGEIAAHYAIRPDNAATGEGCAAVVLPEHRGHDVITRARASAEDGARAIGLQGYYTEPVTTHPFTQKASEHFGATICAIVLGASPSGLRPSHMNVTVTNQRQSLTFYAKMLGSSPARVAYVPSRHREMVAGRYAKLGIAAKMREGSAPHGRGAFSVTCDRGKDSGTIRVARIGAETAATVRQAASDLRSVQRAKAIFALLPLEDPGTPSLAEALEADGFFFGGIQPLVLDEGRDALLMQQLLTPLDTSELSIAGDDGKALLASIEAERERIRQSS